MSLLVSYLVLLPMSGIACCSSQWVEVVRLLSGSYLPSEAEPGGNSSFTPGSLSRTRELHVFRVAVCLRLWMTL